MTVTWKQKVKVEVIDSSQNPKAGGFFGRIAKESLHLDSNSSTKTIACGLFDSKATIELTFYPYAVSFQRFEINNVHE